MIFLFLPPLLPPSDLIVCQAIRRTNTTHLFSDATEADDKIDPQHEAATTGDRPASPLSLLLRRLKEPKMPPVRIISGAALSDFQQMNEEADDNNSNNNNSNNNNSTDSHQHQIPAGLQLVDPHLDGVPEPGQPLHGSQSLRNLVRHNEASPSGSGVASKQHSPSPPPPPSKPPLPRKPSQQERRPTAPNVLRGREREHFNYSQRSSSLSPVPSEGSGSGTAGAAASTVAAGTDATGNMRFGQSMRGIPRPQTVAGTRREIIYADSEDALQNSAVERRGRSKVINEATRPTRPPPRRPMPTITVPVRPIPSLPVAARPLPSGAVPVAVAVSIQPPAKPKRKGQGAVVEDITTTTTTTTTTNKPAKPPAPPTKPKPTAVVPNQAIPIDAPRVRTRPSSGDDNKFLYDNQGLGAIEHDDDDDGEDAPLPAEERIYEEPVVRRRDRTMTAKQRNRQAQSRVCSRITPWLWSFGLLRLIPLFFSLSPFFCLSPTSSRAPLAYVCVSCRSYFRSFPVFRMFTCLFPFFLSWDHEAFQTFNQEGNENDYGTGINFTFADMRFPYYWAGLGSDELLS